MYQAVNSKYYRVVIYAGKTREIGVKEFVDCPDGS